MYTQLPENQYILPAPVHWTHASGQCTVYTSIQPEGAGQPAMSHGTQRKAPRATRNSDVRFSNYFRCSVQIVTVQSNDMRRRLHDH